MPSPVDAIKIQFIQSLDISQPPGVHIEINPQCVTNPIDAILLLQNAQNALLNQVRDAEVAKQRHAIVHAKGLGFPA